MARLKAPTSIGGIDIDPTGAVTDDALIFDGTAFVPGTVEAEIPGGPFLPLAGGTMLGDLNLSEDPDEAMAAATKQYVDAKAALYLPLAGGTLTGPLVLAADPTAALQAATKQYIDNWRDVSNGDYVAADNTISVTNTVEMSTVLAIPASWASYRILAWYHVSYYPSGTLTAVRIIDQQLRMTSVGGTLFGRSRYTIQQTGISSQGAVTTTGFLGGQTATGNVTVCGCLSIAADTGQSSGRDMSLVAIAKRIT